MEKHGELVIDRERIYDAVIEKYGVNHQVQKAIEEYAEAIKELANYLVGKGNVDNLSQEIADVKIVTEQMIKIFKIDTQVEDWEGFKLRRLETRLNKGE